MTLVPALAAFMATGLKPATLPIPSATASPLEIFRAACIAGTVALKRDSAVLVEFKKLRRDAKQALAQSFVHFGDDIFPPKPLSKGVPNHIYRIGPRKNVFLMVPVQEREPQPHARNPVDRYPHSCAVVWKGDQFVEARRLILESGPASALLPGSLPKDNPLGLAHASTTADGLLLTAAAFGGWTVLRSAPEEMLIPGAD